MSSLSQKRPWLWLISFFGVIVPGRVRADWRQEWIGELRYRESLLADWDQLNWRTKTNLAWRSASAFWDALWMQTYRWEDAMIQDIRYAIRMMRKAPGFTAVAVLALGLAAVGLYGAMSYLVNQRTQELGLRMALGASGMDVFKLVVGKGMRLALIGMAIGLVASLALTRLMRSLLFEVTPTDALTFVIVSGVLLTVTLLACYIPARRATNVDPLTSLRYE